MKATLPIIMQWQATTILLYIVSSLVFSYFFSPMSWVSGKLLVLLVTWQTVSATPSLPNCNVHVAYFLKKLKVYLTFLGIQKWCPLRKTHIQYFIARVLIQKEHFIAWIAVGSHRPKRRKGSTNRWTWTFLDFFLENPKATQWCFPIWIPKPFFQPS